MFFKIQNKQDRLLGFSAKRQTKADCCWHSYSFRSHTLLKLSQLLACQTNKKSSLNLTGQRWKTMLGNSLQRLQTIRWPSFGEEYPINWTLRLILAPCNQLQRQTKIFIISFKHNICWTEWFLFQRIVVFLVEIKKIIGNFRFHNNTSASFRDQTVQKIRNFEMSRSLKPTNDAPEFDIDGIIFKIACNGFIFFAKLFINV